MSSKSSTFVFFLFFFFFKILLLLWTIFKALIEFVSILLCFIFRLLWPHGMWDLRLTRDSTYTPCTGR